MTDTTQQILDLISDVEIQRRLELFLRNPNRNSLHPSDLRLLDQAIVVAHQTGGRLPATEISDLLRQDTLWPEHSVERVYNHINIGNDILDAQRTI